MSKFLIRGEEMLKKVVRHTGNSGAIFVPKKWEGRTVVVVLLDKDDGGTPDGEGKETR